VRVDGKEGKKKKKKRWRRSSTKGSGKVVVGIVGERRWSR
jgi:hypothetical protein